jgi:hypothetical protein
VRSRARLASSVPSTYWSGAAGNFVAAVTAQPSNGVRTVADIDLIGTFHVMRAAYPHLT